MNWLKTINISKEKIEKKLLPLKISKSQGPDELHPRLLKKLTEEIVAPLETIFTQSLKEGKHPKNGRLGKSRQSSKREIEDMQETTEQ